MTCKGRSQWLPDEIHPQKERSAAWQGKLSNEVSPISRIWDLSVWTSPDNLYPRPSNTGCCSVSDQLKKSLQASVKDGAAGQRWGRTECAGETAPCILAIPLPSLKSTKSSIKADPVEVTSKGESGSLTTTLLANSFKNMYFLIKTPCSQGRVSKIFSTGPKQLLQELATRMFSIQWEHK